MRLLRDWRWFGAQMLPSGPYEPTSPAQLEDYATSQKRQSSHENGSFGCAVLSEYQHR